MRREKRLTVPQSQLELTPHRPDTWSLHAEKEMRHMKSYNKREERVKGLKVTEGEKREWGVIECAHEVNKSGQKGRKQAGNKQTSAAMLL